MEGWSPLLMSSANGNDGAFPSINAIFNALKTLLEKRLPIGNRIDLKETTF
jgi:hypothetical protein